MKITIGIKEFDLDELEIMQIRNIQYYLEKKKDELFQVLLSGRTQDWQVSAFSLYDDIVEKLSKVNLYLLGKEMPLNQI